MQINIRILSDSFSCRQKQPWNSKYYFEILAALVISLISLFKLETFCFNCFVKDLLRQHSKLITVILPPTILYYAAVMVQHSSTSMVRFSYAVPPIFPLPKSLSCSTKGGGGLTVDVLLMFLRA